MKKKNLVIAVIAVLMMTAGCTAQAQSEKESVITGIISDIKSFMFVITDKEGHEYVLSFDQGKEPKGFSSVKDGDRVTVTYTGELDETEAFTGTVISVEK